MNSRRVLFLTECHPDANPSLGLSNHYNNLFATFKQSGLGEYKVIHYDVMEKNIFNSAVIACLNGWKPELVVLSYLGTHPSNPSDELLKKISASVPIAILWPDINYGWSINKINSLGDIASLHISWDYDVINHEYPEKQLKLWTPQDETMFYNKPEEKVNVASFIGSLNGYSDRSKYLNYVQEHFKDLLVTGGQREQKLSPKEYANYIRRSRIGINFCESPTGKDQCKGRVFEILASGNLLLEKKNEATEKLFMPAWDYIEFNSPKDLLELIEAHIESPHFGAQVAQRGYKTFKEKYNNKIFWQTILSRVQL
jgi:hypothetical protein